MRDQATFRDVVLEIEKLRTEVKAEMTAQLSPIKDDIAEIKSMYVLKAEFQPVKSVVYGLVTSILLTVLGAVLYLVINQP